MKISPVNFNTFKGYDAVPLKRIFFDEFCDLDVTREMEKICQLSGIKTGYFYDCNKWAQDDKTIIRLNSGPQLITNGNTGLSTIADDDEYKIPCIKKDGFLTGGDTFIGKKENGERWILSGCGYLDDSEREKAALAYNVKKENIFVIPSPNFHIDMALRPVGYPYILVNSYELVDKNINKLNDSSDEFKKFLTNAKIYRRHLTRQYAENSDVIEALNKQGFIPVEIAGEYSREVNFINAIVNKKQNGKMTYITNSSDVSGLKFYTKMQEIFEEELRQKVPDIEDIYFVKGKGNSVEFKDNYMMFALRYGHGGIHCMSLEEPDFDIWA